MDIHNVLHEFELWSYRTIFMELVALDHLKKRCLPFFSVVIDPILFKLTS